MEQQLSDRTAECDEDVQYQQCPDALLWMEWEHFIKSLFQHWFWRLNLNLVDVLLRSGIARWINDNVWEFIPEI